jgi:hypothetical protein
MNHIDRILTGLIYLSACYPEQTKKVADLAPYVAGALIAIIISTVISFIHS